MNLLFVVNYYYPYVSGVSEYLRLLCEEFAVKGYNVTVLASNHNKLPAKEIINGVKVVRAPIIGKVSKGTVSTAFIRWAVKMSKEADIVNLHLPMLESGIISSLINKNKLVTTYHCDINLPPGFMNKMIVKIMDWSNNRCLKRSQKIMVTSIDYAKHSRISGRYMEKLVEAPPPIKKYRYVSVERADNKKIIGFCGRIVEEKGIDVLIKAFPIIQRKSKDTWLYIGGDYENVAGGSIYPALKDYIKENKIENIKFLGMIPEEEMEEFYSSLDCFVLPSINSLEAFGMVQVEAMMCKVPVVSSDLYGVRTVVQKTGMGRVSKQGDHMNLAECILDVLEHKEKYVKQPEDIAQIYSTEKSCSDYQECFTVLKGKNEKNN